MLTDEQKAIIANIKSLLQQVDQIESGQEQVDKVEEINNNEVTMKSKKVRKEMPMEEEDPMMEEAAEGETDVALAPPEEEPTVEEIVKSLLKRIKKADSDTVTADDDAEKRLEEGPDMNDEAIAEVAKALMSIMRGKKIKVNKAERPDKIEQAILRMARVMKSIAVNQQQTDAALSSILEGFGIADQLQKQYGPDKIVQKSAITDNRRPIQDYDSARKQLVEEIAASIQKKDAGPNDKNVRKSLGSVMGAIFNQSK